jgi:hypothetical protein
MPPKKVELTDEIRAAVRAEQCAEEGHQLDFTTVLKRDKNNRYEVGSSDPNKLPHVTCRRCLQTWILVDESGATYDEADQKFRDRLRDEDPRKRR